MTDSKIGYFLLAVLLAVGACKKHNDKPPAPPPVVKKLQLVNATLDGNAGPNFIGVQFQPILRFNFNNKIDKSTASAATAFAHAAGSSVQFNMSWEKGDSTLSIQPKAGELKGLSNYSVVISTVLKSVAGGALSEPAVMSFSSQIDSTPKFPSISDDALLTLVQQQTFKYFWDFAHPVSGLARERNNSGDLVTSGGSGFGLMSIVTGIHRGFITRQQGLQRMQIIVDFLKTKAQRFHGAFPHWLNGITGAVIDFSPNDDGADLVETSFLAAGLITVRQYFDDAGVTESALRSDINSILDGIEWSWFRKGNEQVLYWHWSPRVAWAMNMKVTGWNETLITYVMAATSKNYSIPDTVYRKGFARDAAMKNGKTFYNTVLPLGEDYGGPLFFSHYSFLGINPNGLVDQYANYWDQQVAHSKINFEYCKANPLARWGYSASNWGLTASDIPNGYTASSPTNDVGVIAPTAAISSMPYTPAQSMAALKFFYYTMGDKLWKDYGFIDAFKLQDLWFATSFLAIDQGPQIIMIENYRSGLLWNLFTSAPEVKAGMKKLGFTAPYL
jgi:hypothetical protein